MRTQASGPSKGTPPTVRAAEAPITQMVSTEWIWSATSGVATTCTSLRKPSGKDGRSGRSIMRAVRVAFSEGLASRLRYPPGMRPTAYIFSMKSTVRGKKS